jgi:hypothetical protein
MRGGRDHGPPRKRWAVVAAMNRPEHEMSENLAAVLTDRHAIALCPSLLKMV